MKNFTIRNRWFCLLFVVLAVRFVIASPTGPLFNKQVFLSSWDSDYVSLLKVKSATKQQQEYRKKSQERLALAAVERTKQQVLYDGRYVAMDYPGGDVPASIGVCTDVLIRSYRKLGIDLQKDVHEDMQARFDEFPQWYSDKTPNHNIDHRRVPNLMIFFRRYARVEPITDRAEDYLPGDIVVWNLGQNNLHIGLISNRRISTTSPYLVAHNVGNGPELEDFLFYPGTKIIGHFRYYGIKR